MAFFRVNTNEENIKDYTGNSNYINESGIYEVIVKHCVISTSPNGSKSITLYIEYNGQMQPIFQAMRLYNNDGSENLGLQLFNKFCIICGASEGDEINDPVPMTLPIGKGGAEEEVEVLKDFEDIPMFIRIQMQYRLYNGNEQENKVIKNFYRYEDKATASEIVNDSKTKGAQYEKDLEYASNDDIKDGLTEEDVKRIKANRGKKNNNSNSNTKPQDNGFNKKRTFKKF